MANDDNDGTSTGTNPQVAYWLMVWQKLSCSWVTPEELSVIHNQARERRLGGEVLPKLLAVFTDDKGTDISLEFVECMVADYILGPDLVMRLGDHHGITGMETRGNDMPSVVAAFAAFIRFLLIEDADELVRELPTLRLKICGDRVMTTERPHVAVVRSNNLAAIDESLRYLIAGEDALFVGIFPDAVVSALIECLRDKVAWELFRLKRRAGEYAGPDAAIEYVEVDDDGNPLGAFELEFDAGGGLDITDLVNAAMRGAEGEPLGDEDPPTEETVDLGLDDELGEDEDLDGEYEEDPPAVLYGRIGRGEVALLSLDLTTQGDLPES